MGAFHQNYPDNPQHTVQQQQPPEAPVSFGVGTPNQAPNGKGGMAGPPPAPRTESVGKSGGAPMTAQQPAAKGGSNITYPEQSGQPTMGAPNQYASTIQPMGNPGARAVGASMKGKGS